MFPRGVEEDPPVDYSVCRKLGVRNNRPPRGGNHRMVLTRRPNTLPTLGFCYES